MRPARNHCANLVGRGVRGRNETGRVRAKAITDQLGAKLSAATRRLADGKTPLLSQRGFSHGIKRREVEKRIYGLKEVAHGFHNLHGDIIRGAFERRMEELKTNLDKFMNNCWKTGEIPPPKT